MLSITLFMLSGLISGGLTWPFGPPPSTCQSMDPIGHMLRGFTSSSLNYTITTSTESIMENEILEIHVSGPERIKGIFVQVRDESGYNIVGHFEKPHFFGLQVMNCLGVRDGALAHSTGQPKLKTIKALWRAPRSCHGTYTVKATVMVNFGTFQTGLTHSIQCRSKEKHPMQVEGSGWADVMME